jgi:hypothetical protein
MRFILLTTAAAVMAMSAPAPAQINLGYYQGPWRTIARKSVNAGGDRDTVKVSDRYRFRAIRLCAERAPVAMRDLDVIYGNGRRDDINVRARIRAGTCTRALDLQGGRNREIERILLYYDRARPDSRKPTVVVQAR